MNFKRELCTICVKPVYLNERSAADGKVFHKACFRCQECKTILSLGKYASMDNKTFCKPCFKKMFLSKGNYSEGFGQLKPQAQHELKKSSSQEIRQRGQSTAPMPTPTPVAAST